MLHVRNVSLAFGGPALVDGASFEVREGERVCLVGRNGAGKSSLLKVLGGRITPDEGEVYTPAGTRVAMLDQEASIDVTGSIRSVVDGALDGEQLEQWERDARVDRLLADMELDSDVAFESLSAGMKRRVLLACCLVLEPGVLLLDEPTNHMDVDAIGWMENFLPKYRGALLFITHDRAFLQNLATRILDLERGVLISWDCDYQTYLERKEAWLQAEARQWAEFDKKLAKEEVWIRRGIEARRTRNEGRVRSLLKMREEHRGRRERQGQVNLAMEEADRSGLKVISTEGATFSYDNRPIIRDFTTLIRRGDKVGIVGTNGAGKSTLVKLLLGKLQPQAGWVKHGSNLEIAYFDQLREALDPEMMVVDAIAGGLDTVTINGQRRHVMGYLGDFLFSPDRARGQVKVLSGGERNRLLLARLFTKPFNVLVMDEPTNDLDLETLELLEERLLDYSGTLLLVSHDRAFLDNVVTELFVLEGDGVVQQMVGGYSDYLTIKKKKATAATTTKAKESTPPKGKTPKPRKFLNRERWEWEALPGEIEKLEAEQSALAEKLGEASTYQDANKLAQTQARLEELETLLLEKYERWEELDTLKSELEG
ncbi:ATP-binding cassette domain-containing protein [Cerasicoccus frondis]|uniref:ATP-binding cassette domain-containing protein n=1 Tax=Cerasicoccus frondis TaxID=490090 RepID=UPI002852A083|nr:ATP-binding cassette domain-containing protein [Cerasicoccus frondis]